MKKTNTVKVKVAKAKKPLLIEMRTLNKGMPQRMQAR